MGLQGVLIEIKDGAIVNWVLNMQKTSLFVTLQQLELKVVEVTQTRPMFFLNGVLGNS